MDEFTFGSLFSGIGGFDLGFERAGMRCAWQVEIDDKCNETLDYHWPDVPKFGDVKDVGKRNLESVDLISGGFPCQDLSVAGKREGLAGERSGLWFEFYRILAELRPRWVVIENVPGLLSSNGGRDFAIILRGLAEIGYLSAWRVLDAQYFGVAQRRRRVFIVGSLGDGRAAEVLFEREGGAWDIAPGREARTRVADPITKSFAKHHGRSAGKDSYPRNVILAAHDTGQGWWNQAEFAGTLRAEGENRPSRPSNLIVQHALSGHNQRNDPDGEHFVVATLNSGGNDGGFRTEPGEHLIEAWNWQSGGDVRFSFGKPNLQANQVPAVGVRRLTPTECERLQGFPDGWTSVNGMKDSPRYRMLGNAVCVSVAEWIGRRIISIGKEKENE